MLARQLQFHESVVSTQSVLFGNDTQFTPFTLWHTLSAGLAPVQKPSNRGLSEEKLVYLPPKGFFNRSCRFFDLKKKLWGVPVEAKILSPRADAIKVVLHVSFYKKKF